MMCSRINRTCAIASLAVLAALGSAATRAQQADAAAIIRSVDAAARYRYDNVLGFTDIEHYAIFRGNDETHPAAEMTVKTSYRKGSGKTYDILSESGSSFLLKVGLHPLLDNEKDINVPGHVEQSWFTSANYEMKLRFPTMQHMNGRDCYALQMIPRHKAPNMIDGTLWADAQNGTVVRIDGVASKNPSIFSGTTHMMRDYMYLDGFSMSSHARAESNGVLIGRTVVTIDYSDYHLQIRAAK